MWTVLLVLGACSPPPYTPPTVDTGGDTAADVEDTAPGIEITWPATESDVTGCAMVVVNLKNLRITDPAVSPDPVDGEGHYHLYYEGHYTPCYKPFCLVGFDESGPTQVQAELNQNDHTPILDDDGNTITANLLLNVTAGECAAGTPSGKY